MKQSSFFQKLFLTTFTILGWAAIVLQFYLLLKNRSLPVGATIVQFFSYFTILTNILVASYSTALLIAPSSKRGLWFSKPSITTSLAVYIIIVGAVYNIILRFLWSPTGLQKLVDEALHSVIPLLFLIYWLLFVQKEKLKWKDAFSWLLYPIFYLAYILMRGSVTNLYPYPFLEINSIGTTRVVINILVLCAVFFGMSLLLVGTGKLITSKKTIRTSE
jgi:hypothetical protein